VPATHSNRSGITLIEALVAIAVLFILVSLLMPPLSGSRKAKVPVCMSNLKQVSLAFLIYAEDNRGHFPMQVPVANGGTMEFIYSDHAFPHFEKLRRYAPNPRLLICPFETNRQAAVSYEALTDLNISYFLNADASTNDASRSILAGDRFLQVNKQPIAPGLFVLPSNSNLSWTSGFHAQGGSLAFADGHVEFSHDDRLHSILQSQPLGTNRFCIP